MEWETGRWAGLTRLMSYVAGSPSRVSEALWKDLSHSEVTCGQADDRGLVQLAGDGGRQGE